ncbi:NTP pyrophosphohydrolase [Streptomyces griseocarneus]|nr:NTP pyrophosphohydrolase [Streptomyces griseocarneus]
MTPYDRLRAARPELFGNDPDGIEIVLDPDGIEEARRVMELVVGEGPQGHGVVYTDPFVTVVRDAVRFPGGFLGLYVRMLSTAAAPGAVVLPLAGADGVVLVEHYRHATRSWHWEAPRGNGRTGASGAETAARELAEELGTQATELVPLGRVHPDTGLLGDCVELFAARVEGTGTLDTAEGIRRAVTRPWPTVADMIANGDITCGFTIAAFTRARLKGLLGSGC